MLGQNQVAFGETTPGQEGIAFWSRRWDLASPGPDILPAFEDVGLGSIGAHAETLALVQMVDGRPKILQASAQFHRWLNESEDHRPRPDGWMKLTEMGMAAITTRRRIEQRCSGIHGDRIETRPLLAMPLASRWFPQLVLIYIGPLLASHNITETVYRTTREGFLMFMPVRTETGGITDFCIAAANPGAAALLRQDLETLRWRTCTTVFGDMAPGLIEAFIVVLQSGETRQLELDFTETRDLHLQASAAPLDAIVVLTLTDVTEMRAREAGFRLMFEANPVPMALVDTTTMRFLDVNAAALQHYGYERDTLVGAEHAKLIHPHDRPLLEAVQADPSPSYEGARIWRHLHADGREIAVRPYARRLTIRKQPAALVAFFDVTESRAAEEELRSTKLFVDTVIENIPSALLVEDAEDRRLLLINKTGEALLGIGRSEVLGRPAGDHFSMDAASDGSAVERSYHSTGAEPVLLSVRKLDVPDGRGMTRYRLTIADDVTERRAFEERIAHMAHHDALTDLPNRTLFSEQVHSALTRSLQNSDEVALLAIDLDAFKAVNDTLGHGGGDALLREVAGRLRSTIRRGDSVARLGGDEFAVLVTKDCDTVASVAARLIAELARPFFIQGHDVRIGASLGIARAPKDGMDGETLLRHADLALYRAKQEGRGTFRFFEPSMNHEAQARRELERDLRVALTNGEFELHYQPVMRLADRSLSGCEALIRWRHPARGLVSPGDFIGLAEETGLIGPIGAWALRQACHDASQWPQSIKVAVNVSAIQFRDPQLVATVISALTSAGLPPQRLEIEITESVLFADTATHLAMLHRLRDLGVKIAMDDFGTGYSSLSYLSTFPFDKIKIDRSFIRDLSTSRHNEAIVGAVIDLGQHLGIATVAEGVETESQAEQLMERGCQLAQGYLFSRPVPAADLDLWLKASRVLDRSAA